MQKIIILVAMTKYFVIGNYEKLPWSIPEELKHFTQTTAGKTIIVGRKTYSSMRIKELNNRNFIVVSRSGLSLKDALENTKFENEIIIAGGLEIFKQTLPLATHIIVSFIDKDYVGNIFFPNLDFNVWNIERIEKKRYFQIFWMSRVLENNNSRSNVIC